MDLLRLGLKQRLYGGFGILVLISLALAGFAVSELSGIRTEVQKFSAINDNTSRALEVAKRIEIIRRANLRFTVDADEQMVKDGAAAESSAIDILKEAADAALSEGARSTTVSDPTSTPCGPNARPWSVSASRCNPIVRSYSAAATN
jgi:hypothetical protein